MESASTINIYSLRHIEKLTRSLRSLFRFFFGASQLVNENRSCALPMEQSSFTKYLRSYKAHCMCELRILGVGGNQLNKQEKNHLNFLVIWFSVRYMIYNALLQLNFFLFKAKSVALGQLSRKFLTLIQILQQRTGYLTI